MVGLDQLVPRAPPGPQAPLVTQVLEGPLDIVVPPESWETLDPEETRGTEETKARLAWAWMGLTGTKGSKDRRACLALARTAKTGPTASPASPATLAFPGLLVLRGPLASVTRRPAKEP